MTRIRLSVIGYGNLSRNTYCPFLHALADRVELASLVELDDQRRAQAADTYNFGQTYSTVGEMLADGPPDAALVLLPAKVHAEAIRQLLTAGADVYTEKPDTYGIDEARELVALAHAKQRVYQVGQNRLFMTATMRARQFFSDTPIDFIHVEKSKTVDGMDSAYLLDDGIHVMSPMMWLAGDVECVLSAHFIPGRLLSAHFRLASGGAATLTQHVDDGYWVERFLMHGAKKSANLTSPDGLELYDHGAMVEGPLVGRCPLLFDTAGLLGFRDAVSHFLDCVESRQEPKGSAASLLRVHEVMNEVFSLAGLPTL